MNNSKNITNLARISLASLTVLILACGQIDALRTTPTTPPSPPQWIVEWLEDPLCLPPCWESIKPGVTQINTIEQIKQRYPYVDVEAKRDSAIVQLISLNLAITDNLPFELLVSKFGSPTHVRIYKCDPNARCETHVIFVDFGMVLNLYPFDLNRDNLNATVEIAADTPVYNIYFLETGLENYLFLFHGSENDLVQWNGYDDYSNSP